MCLSAIVNCHQPINETIQEILFSNDKCQGTPSRTIQPDLTNPGETYCYAWGDFWVHNLCPNSDYQPEFFTWLDLSRFVPKLLKEESEDFPSEAFAKSAILEYKRYLAIKQKFPKIEIAPSPIVDKVWHMHILDTKQYMRDCNLIFGEYMHHGPSFDPDEEEQKEMMDRYERTLELYQKLFGMSPVEMFWARIPSVEEVQQDVAGGFCPSCCAM
jgi:hypothetical protein